MALRLLGIHTAMSCGGHVDRLLSPYVTFASPDPNNDLRRAYAKDEDLRTRRRLKRRRVRRNAEELRVLLPRLERFYQGRDVPQSKRLIVHGFGPSGYQLTTQAADLVALAPQSERRALLDEERQEFRAFTEFLKAEFFGAWGRPWPAERPTGQGRSGRS
ncbi:hypothetical protein OG806_08245 [Streptomyces sp. NBC_00882]|uniref:hypothetical protein n=1 Tax=Streptomyces sp. NBC_00882 TaxID=2975856 RepID=UPI0038683DA6|nr:hypothetical protein OG806_08245 [Streptomyces sp. NBC_00882]